MPSHPDRVRRNYENNPKMIPSEDMENISCPVCGYYCLGKGGVGCIDKPFLVEKYGSHKIKEVSTSRKSQ